MPTSPSLAGDLVWVERKPATRPTPRVEFSFVYDPVRNEGLLFGGSSDLSFAAVNAQTWAWDCGNWTLRSLSGMPRRSDNAKAFDSQRNEILSFAGYDGTYLGDTWRWNGSQWLPTGAPGPAARADSSMVFDSVRGVMVLFGGQASNLTILGDTCQWDGTQWLPCVAGGPPPRWIHRMAFDSQRGVTVLFGGAGSSTILGDTWEWNGKAWEQKATTGPSPRYGFAIAYDPDRQRTVLFGGQTELAFGVGVLGDTWEWDGAQWMELPVAGPPARTFTKMIYQAATRSMVLFGGYNGTSLVNDTWELIDLGRAGDVDADGTLDSIDNCPCDPNGGQGDADGDGVGDPCDNCALANSDQRDCQPNTRGDPCDIADAVSADTNANGVPDECELPVPAVEPNGVLKPRAISFAIPASASLRRGGPNLAVQIRLIDLPPAFAAWEGARLWLGEPGDICESSGVTTGNCPGGVFMKVARLQCDPVYTDWTSQGVVHVLHEAIVPDGAFELRTIFEGADPADEGNFSAPLEVRTSRWGDCCGAFAGGQWPGPDGSVAITSDVVAVLDKFSNRMTAPIKARTDVEPACQDLRINITDVTRILDAFRGLAYPFTPSARTPCASPCR